MNSTKFALGFASLGLLVASHVASAEQLMTNRYDLPAGELVTIKGNLFSTKKINCLVRSDNATESNLSFVSLHNKNIVDGLIINEGETTSKNVTIGQNIALEMDHHSQLGVTNNSETLINLECK